MVSRPKLLYILSVGHSGSTLLDIMLGAHPKGVSLGELAFKGDFLNISRKCSCGVEPLLACKHWRRVNARLEKAEQGFEKLRLAGLSSCSNNELFYRSLCDATGAQFVVESTKSVSRLRDLARCEHLEMHVVLLIRNPVAVAASNVRRGRSFWRYTLAYLINVSSQTHLSRHFSRSVVRYEELVQRPVATVERVFADARVSGEWPEREWQRQEYHLSGGNPIRFNSGHELKLDERWKSEMSLLQIGFVRLVVNPLTLKLMELMFAVVRPLRAKGLPNRRGQDVAVVR